MNNIRDWCIGLMRAGHRASGLNRRYQLWIISALVAVDPYQTRPRPQKSDARKTAMCWKPGSPRNCPFSTWGGPIQRPWPNAALNAILHRFGHRIRHYFLLGGPHDRPPPFHRKRAIPRCVHHWSDSRCPRPNVQIQRQRWLDPLDIIDGVTWMTWSPSAPPELDASRTRW